MAQNPGQQLVDVRSFGPDLVPFHIAAKLGLSSGAAGKDNQRPGDSQSNGLSEIFFKEGKGEIDSGGNPA